MLLSGDLSQTCITSGRLTLKAFTSADAAESFAEANARIARYMSWNPPSETEYEAIWRQRLMDMKLGRDLALVVTRLAGTNEFMGMAGLHPAEGALLETGVWIKESAQRHGYGREAVAAVIKWASETFHPAGFLWPVVDENLASRRLAESLGAEIIGTRQRQKPGDVNRTLLLYSISVERSQHIVKPPTKRPPHAARTTTRTPISNRVSAFTIPIHAEQT